jgi:hypothetical protein
MVSIVGVATLALACSSQAAAATAANPLPHCSAAGLRGVSDLEAGAWPGASVAYGADCQGAQFAASTFIASRCSEMSVSTRTANGKYVLCADTYDLCVVARSPTARKPKSAGIECQPKANANALIKVHLQVLPLRVRGQGC